jgi:cytochrome d ubiquinol oxidase subunit II
MPLDYETLRIIWWLLLAVLLIGFAIFDGFDLGVAALLPFVGHADGERRLVINAVGPVWEGNQVWFILGGGAAFAAWPPLYAASFSGFYVAMFLVLIALILRPVAFKFRSKIDDRRWRHTWDWVLCIGGIVPALIFGVAIGNLLQGVPFYHDEVLRPIYSGSFIDLLNRFGLICGLVSVCMLVAHGGTFAAMKTSGPVSERSRRYAILAAVLTVALFVSAGFMVASSVPGYAITSEIDPSGPSDPSLKTVTVAAGAWMNSYETRPWIWLAPAIGVVCPLLAALLLWRRHHRSAFLISAAGVAGIVATPALAMFPFIMPSSSMPNASLTVWDASSSHITLFIMLIATIVFLPIVLAYTAWVYRVLRGRIEPAHIDANKQAY